MADQTQHGRPSATRIIPIAVAIGAVAAVAITALLVNIFEHKQEAKNPFFRVVELTDDTEDPAIWAKNFPQQYDAYRRTVDQKRTRYGVSSPRPSTLPGKGSSNWRNRYADEFQLGWWLAAAVQLLRDNPAILV